MINSLGLCAEGARHEPESWLFLGRLASSAPRPGLTMERGAHSLPST